MAYTRYTKNNGSLRLVIDRMSLAIGVICLVLSLVLAFVGGYLAGFNSRVSHVASAQRQQVVPPSEPDAQPEAIPSPEPVERPQDSLRSEPDDLLPADTASASSGPMNTAQPPVAPPSLPRQASIDSVERVQPERASLSDLYWHLASKDEIETFSSEGDAEPLAEDLPDEQQGDVRTQYERDLAQLSEQGRTPEPVEERQPPEPLPEKSRSAQGRYTVQVGAFRSKENADRMLGRVRAMGYEAERIYTWYVPGDFVYCVWVGHYDDLDSAAAAAALYSEREAEDAVAVRRIIRR